MASGELFAKLQDGAIDGAEWVGPYNDLSLGLYKITKFYYWPGFQEPGTGLECIVNKGKFSALPDDLKQIVAAACMAENGLTAAEYSGRSPAALATLVNEHDVQLKKFSRDVLIAFGNASSEVVKSGARQRRRRDQADRHLLSQIPEDDAELDSRQRGRLSRRRVTLDSITRPDNPS